MEKIYWRDITGLSDRWMEKDELIQEAKKEFDSECWSVGEVIYENDDFVIICATQNQQDEYHDASMIMKSVIIKRELI